MPLFFIRPLRGLDSGLHLLSAVETAGYFQAFPAYVASFAVNLSLANLSRYIPALLLVFRITYIENQTPHARTQPEFGSFPIRHPSDCSADRHIGCADAPLAVLNVRERRTAGHRHPRKNSLLEFQKNQI